ncbi:hypothetical protein ACJZ2D_010032 [Fusarium nematophilum]
MATLQFPVLPASSFTETYTRPPRQEVLSWRILEQPRSKQPAIYLQHLEDDDGKAAEGADPSKDHDKKDGHNPDIDTTVTLIMDLLESFSLQQQGNDVFLGRDVFSPRVRRHVAAGRKIPMVLPAFPAKSINVVEKVLGTRPDFGEELALERLNDLCSRIQKVYMPGAMVLIATDGACYNDLTGVTDNDLWEYGVTLRQMVSEKGYRCIDFVRIMNLLGLYSDPVISKERFISLLEPSRRELMNRYADPSFDATACIKNDPDYKMTYDGYAKFLKKDLAFGAVRESVSSGKKFKAKVHETAKAMIARGIAFAELIREEHPEHVRLSIHPSTGLTKISMPLIPQPDSFSMTPWHCAVAVDIYGNFKTSHVAALKNTHELVHRHGRSYFFRERSKLWEWDAEVEFAHLYGRGLVVHNVAGPGQRDTPLSDADKEKLACLAVTQGRLILKGFE